MDSNTVDLIATDPPFNKSKDFHATPDSLAAGASFQDRWSWDDALEEWQDKIKDDFPRVWNVIWGSRQSYGDDMGGFLCFMGVRIIEMHRVLKQTGSMYLHCDPTASHYLKELMDSIFKHKNFRSEIVWRRSNAHNKLRRQYGPIHDILLFYTKTDEFTFAPGIVPYSKKYVNGFKTDERGSYHLNNITGPGIRHGDSGKKWGGFDPTKVGRHWAVPKALKAFLPDGGKDMTTMQQLEFLHDRELILIPKKGAWPVYKQYLGRGILYQDIWAYQPNTNGVLYETDACIDEDVKYLDNEPEKTGYPTQKPIGLYERIIRTSSNKGDVVLDPFCGCATTCVAAEKLGRQWIGIDIWDKAHEVVIERLRKEGFLARPGEKRQDILITRGEITYVKKPLKRKDGGSEAVPFLETKMKLFDDSEHDPYSNKEKKCMLLEQCGPCCQGCGIELHERYLELDHKEPRSAGGSNLIRNRILLCGPCNKLKRDLYTLVWLRRENIKLGYMINEKVLAPLKG